MSFYFIRHFALIYSIFRGATAGKAPKALDLPRFWVSIHSYKKQLVKNIWGRILGLAWLKFTGAPLILYQCLDGVVVSTLAFHAGDRGSIPPHGPTNFQLSFFSFSYFWGHQTFLFKTSNLRNHPSFRCSEWRVISHIKGLP